MKQRIRLAATDTTINQEHNREFGRAVQAGSLLTSAFAGLIKGRKEHGQVGRLNKRLLKIQQMDVVNRYGERRVVQGDLSLLAGFDFFQKSRLRTNFHGAIGVDINAAKGSGLVQIPVFHPREGISYEGPYTHLMFSAGLAAVDFEREQTVTHIVRSEFFDREEPVTTELRPQLPEPVNVLLVLAVGLEFYKVVNGEAYPIGGQRSLSLRIQYIHQPGKKRACFPMHIKI